MQQRPFGSMQQCPWDQSISPRLPDFIQSAHNSWGTSRRTHPNGSVALSTRAEMTHWINSIKAGEFDDLIS